MTLRSPSLLSDASSVVTSTSSSSSSTSTTGTTNLARISAAAGPLGVHQDVHPLSPELHLATGKRTSYFRPSPSLLAGEADVIFKDSDELQEQEAKTRHRDDDAEEEVNTPKVLDASPKLQSKATTFSATIRLPKPPHLMAHTELKRHIAEQDIHGNRVDIAFVQELSRQLSETHLELDRQRKRQDAREAALLQLLRENAAGQTTEGMINRALVRANAEASERCTLESNEQTSWKMTVKLPRTNGANSKNEGMAERLPLSEDLQDAMSEADFAEHALATLTTVSQPHRRHSPKARGSSTSSSPVSVSNSSLQERRGRQASTSLSTRLFGSFSPSSPSHLSPTVGSIPAALETANTSPSQAGIQKKARANSIRSVQSTSSVASHSQKGVSGWAGSLWSWKQGSSKHRYHSESEDEEEEVAGDEAHRVNRRSSTPGKTGADTSPSRDARTTDTDRSSSTRPRAASKTSSNSTSNKSIDTTAATSFTSSYAPVFSGEDESGPSSPIPTTSSPIQSLRALISASSPQAASKPKALGTSLSREGPVRMLLSRRSSGLHPDAALTTDVVPTPISASGPTPTSSLHSEIRSSSAAMLQSISSLHDKHPTLDVPEPTHFRAVSESASTIGKSGGNVVANEVYKTPDKVSENVNQWTQRLLASFSPPALSPISAVHSAAVSQTEGDSPSPVSRRSRSPRLKAGKSKAAPSPATIHNDATATTIRLSAASPTDEMVHETMEEPASDEAMPLAPKTNIKQKGYLASAKGTIGRALGYSSHSGSGKGARRNSLKCGTEPTLTLPTAFTSFASSATSSVLSTPATATHPPSASHPPKTASGALEMGTIVAPEAKPPSLSTDLADQMKNGPLVDRFGFVYDIKAGMKLLKENRKKQQDKDEIMSLDSPPHEVNVDELKEALGPSPCPTPALDTALAGAALHLSISNLSKVEEEDESVAPKIQATLESKAPAMSEQPSNQSIRRLLTQLGEMNESVEKAQKESWDSFIKRRKAKASRPKSEEEQAAAKKKRMTMIEAPLSTGSLPDEDAEVDQFTENLVGVASMGTGKQDDKVFRQLVKSGIPIVYRPAIWAEVSGASEIREPGLYQELLSRHAGEKSPCLEQIDMDTHRTFPTNVFFAGNGPGVLKLRRVLIAYSWRDPSIGYCQGMNLLAALLLLVYPDEEDAFWMLSSVLERILPSDYYSSQLLVSQADQRVLQDLIELALPDLYAHLEDLGVDLPAITFGWFLSLFTDALPIQTLLRVWDVLLVYGPISLFKIAIAIFKIHSAEIFATDSASNFYVLLTSLTSHMYSADKLLKTAFDDLRFIKRHDIESRRLKHVADIERELAPLPA